MGRSANGLPSPVNHHGCVAVGLRPVVRTDDSKLTPLSPWTFKVLRKLWTSALRTMRTEMYDEETLLTPTWPHPPRTKPSGRVALLALLSLIILLALPTRRASDRLWRHQRLSFTPARSLATNCSSPLSSHRSGAVFLQADETCGRLEHPIISLMRDAERLWNDKVARRSKTLEEAVAEYERRHGRAPPKGFDRWCVRFITHSARLDLSHRRAFVEQHNVQLPDEYDIIREKLEPFWAVRPACALL